MATLGEHRGAVNRLAVAQVGMGVIEGTNDVYLYIYMCVYVRAWDLDVPGGPRAKHAHDRHTRTTHTHTFHTPHHQPPTQPPKTHQPQNPKDYAFVASGSDDGTVKIWELKGLDQAICPRAALTYSRQVRLCGCFCTCIYVCPSVIRSPCAPASSPSPPPQTTTTTHTNNTK